LVGFVRAKDGSFILSSAFLDKFWLVRGMMSHSQIATGGQNLISLPRQIIQKNNNQPLGGWALAESAGGRKGSSVLWLAKFDKNLTFGGGGGVNHSQIASSRLNSISAPS
jgi:hypothetical protein